CTLIEYIKHGSRPCEEVEGDHLITLMRRYSYAVFLNSIEVCLYRLYGKVAVLACYFVKIQLEVDMFKC
uniref:hypothetical protein n=1 Tax=Photobacterium leiognathi TaxID=553611 RepID=UPI002982B602